MKRIIALACVLLLLLSMLLSCNQTSNSNDTDTSDEVTNDSIATDTENIEESLDISSDIYFDGAEVRILVGSASLKWHEYIESAATSIVDQAVFQRNTYATELLGIQLWHKDMNGYSSGSTAFCNAIRTSTMGGDEAYHIVSPGSYYGTELIVEGCYNELNSVKHVDLSKKYWFENYLDAISINGKVYAATGDYSVASLSCMEAIFFNKELVADYKLEDPFEMVENNTWTWENVIKMAKQVSSTENIGDDAAKVYGLTLNNQAAKTVPNTAGERMVELQSDGSRVINIKNDTNINLLELFRNAADEGTIDYHATTSTASVMVENFIGGKSLFLMHCFEGADALRSSDLDYGIVVCPKYNSEQERYYTSVAGDSTFMIPVGMNDEATELAGAALQTMSYFSYKYVTPAYFENTLKYMVAQDAKSSEMMELIRDSVIYDFTMLYMRAVPGMDAFANCMPGGIHKNLSTWFGANGKVVELKLSALLANEYFND